MIEMVALDEEQMPDWLAGSHYIDALIIEEIGDDLLLECGVNTEKDARPTWLETVKERLRDDMERFRDDIETDRDEIEVWEYAGSRIFVTLGRWADEDNPSSAHGWMCRLADSGVLGAAGFHRLRKADLLSDLEG